MATKKIFLSWSKDKAKEISSHLKKWLEQLFEGTVSVYFSRDSVGSGEDWWKSLSDALRESDMGIVCVTSDNLNAEATAFEAGALAFGLKGESGKKLVCPLLVDISPIQLGELMKKFQYRELSDKTQMKALVVDINELGGKQGSLRPQSALDTAFERSWKNFIREAHKLLAEISCIRSQTSRILPAATELIEKYKIDPLEASIKYGIITAIPGHDFYRMRRDFVESARNSLTIVGSSLCEAFNRGSDGAADISEIIEKHIRSSDYNNPYYLDVFLSEPRNFAVSSINDPSKFKVSPSPLRRIEITLGELLDLAKGDLLKRIRMSIYFIPLLQIDHIVQAGDLMIIRNTMLWTKNGDLKGTWMLCQKVPDTKGVENDERKYAMYNVYSKYISELRKESISVTTGNFCRDSKGNVQTDADEFHEKWRNAFFELDPSGQHIQLFKLYRKQLISALHSTWGFKYRHYSPEVHVDSPNEIFRVNANRPGAIKERSDLFKAENLLGERVQQSLLEHLRVTENMLDGLMRHYDKSGGFAQIYPSFDLGLPNNVQRLAGGFATGIFVLWRCGTPIIPVDTTVNACSSSVYSLDQDQFACLNKNFDENYLNKIFLQGHEEDFLNSFSSGNHFILIARNRETGEHCLFLHSSAKEFKYTTLGLYPHPGVWYWDKIRVYTSPDKKSNRYIRYLKDDDANDFIRTAQRLPEFNKRIHDWFAAAIVGSTDVISNCLCTKHHYYMPTSYSVAMGTFLEQPGETVPVFSRPEEPIYLFQSSVAGDQPWTINLAGVQKCLIPHGYGQTLGDGSLDLTIDIDSEDSQNRKLLLNGKDYEIAPRVSIDRDATGIGVRNFGLDKNPEPEFFARGAGYFSGRIVSTFDQVAYYQKGKVTRLRV